MASYIPESMRVLNQWVLWKEESRDGDRPTKIPYQTNGLRAKPNDPETWSDFATVEQLSLVGSWSGVGFVFCPDDGFCGIDLDGCRNPETGKMEEWAKEIILRFDSYAEVSPSGTGVKIFVSGKSPLSSGRKVDLEKPAVGGKRPGIEVYDNRRYFAVTGMRLAGMPHDPQPCQDVLDGFCERWFPSRSKPKAKVAEPEVSGRARRYLSRMPPAVSGESGHNVAFRTACVLVKGFGLSPDDAYPIIAEWNQTCNPPWSDGELRHKLSDAVHAEGEDGYLLDVVKPPKATTHTQPDPLPKRETLESSARRYLEKVRTGQNKLVSLGIPDLDHAIGGGVEYGELIVVGARPGHGKSAVGLQVTYTAAQQGLPCLIISEEMTALALGKRAVQYASDVAEEWWQEKIDAVEEAVEDHFRDQSPCYITESCGTVERAERVIRQAVADDGVKLVVIDYAQLLRGQGNGRYEQVTNTSIVLRQLATELGIIMVVLCQLNREIEKRDKWVPRMGDLRDSGQIEQDADVLLFLLWPHRLDPARDSDEYVVFVSKNRSRPTVQPVVKCTFKPSRQMFVPDENSQTPHENRYWDNDDDDSF